MGTVPDAAVCLILLGAPPHAPRRTFQATKRGRHELIQFKVQIQFRSEGLKVAKEVSITGASLLPSTRTRLIVKHHNKCHPLQTNAKSHRADHPLSLLHSRKRICPMVMRVEGWLQCETCGHNGMPLDPEFKCTCSKCATSKPSTFPD
jgi:hypothetical protein